MVWFDRYEAEEILGKGAYGLVVAAYDYHMQRKVAIKIINASEEKCVLEMTMMKEKKLSFLPEIYDAWVEEDGSGVIVMEYIEGETLKSYIEQHRHGMEIAEVYQLGIQMGEFLMQLHSEPMRVLHCDLKPENIMIQRDGNIRVLDIGNSVVLQNGVYRDGIRTGTHNYASPELWNGENIDERSDIYSLGIILKELLSCVGNLHKNVKEQDAVRWMKIVADRCSQKYKNKRPYNAEMFLKQWKKQGFYEKAKIGLRVFLQIWSIFMLLILCYFIYYVPATKNIFYGIFGYLILLLIRLFISKNSYYDRTCRSVLCISTGLQ